MVVVYDEVCLIVSYMQGIIFSHSTVLLILRLRDFSTRQLFALDSFGFDLGYCS